MDDQLQMSLFEQPDGSHQVVLSLPTGHYSMNSEQLSAVIDGMVQNRVQMIPAIPMDAPPIPNMQNVAESPPMRWAYDEMNDRAALVIRHPGHGWVGYAIPIPTVEELIAGLQNIVDIRNSQRLRPN